MKFQRMVGFLTGIAVFEGCVLVTLGVCYGLIHAPVVTIICLCTCLAIIFGLLRDADAAGDE